MADAIVWQIAANLKTALSTLVTYPNSSTPTVEYERMFLKINGRYPYIQICGPWVESDITTHKTTYNRVNFMLKYYINKQDENQTVNGELPRLTQDVASDIIKKITIDQSRSSLAQKTEITDYGYAYDASFEDFGVYEYYVYVNIVVHALINISDISIKG